MPSLAHLIHREALFSEFSCNNNLEKLKIMQQAIYYINVFSVNIQK